MITDLGLQEDPQDALRDICVGLREIYLGALEAALGNRSTEGSCFYACTLLDVAVKRFAAMTSVIRGGDGVLDGGYRDGRGRTHGHYWVEASSPDGRSWVLDITADQFGGPEVVVEPIPRARAVYLPGDQATVDEHVAVNGFGTGSA